MRYSKTFLNVLLVILAIASAHDFNKMTGSIDTSISLEDKITYTTYGSLIQPQARASTNFEALSDEICGGVSSDYIHLITTPDLPTRFQWYVHTPFPDSTCLLRLSQVSQPKEKDFTIITPIDGVAVNKDGSFECGRTGPAIESHTFAFQQNMSCDHCVVEWIWKTPKGNVRQCADMSISGSATTTSKCPVCQNGGVCSKNKCICPNGYGGDLCQSTALAIGGGSHTIWIIIGAVILGVLIIGACLFLRKPKNRGQEKNKNYQDYRVEHHHESGPPNHNFKPFDDEH